MALSSVLNCKSIFHKIVTGDGDYMRAASITEEKIQAIQPGRTTYSDLRKLFDYKESNKWTYRKAFWITLHGKRLKVDKVLSYLEVVEYDPRELQGATVYAWKEQRFVQAYLYNNVVQDYKVSHLVRNTADKRGYLSNYDPETELKYETMNGLNCVRLIYDVVSLGRTLSSGDQYDFDKYCRPLIIEE